MDIHVIAPLASPAERAAVDALLGPPTSGWAGGPRDSAIDGHSAHGGHAARAERDLLLPALHAVQDRIGWISQPALAYICRRLTVPPAEAYGVATFYALLATRERAPIVAHVCDDIACRLAGAEEICADLARTIGPAGQPSADGPTTWLRSPCLGLCERAPAALFTVAGEAPEQVGVAPIDAVGVTARLATAAGGRRIAPTTARARARLPRNAWPPPGSRSRRPATTGCACWPASAGSTRPRSTRTGPPAATRRWPGDRAGPRGRDRRGDRLEAARPGRRRLPDRPQVGRGPGRHGLAQVRGVQRRRVRSRARSRTGRCSRDDPFVVIEAMTIEAFATGASRASSTSAASTRWPPTRLRNAIATTPAGRPARPGHPRLGLRLRDRAADRRRRLHLRRGDGPLQLDRGQARRATQQAAVPGRGRPVRQADRGQQRRDPGQRAADPARRRRGVRRDRHRGFGRPEALLRLRATSAGRGSTRSRSGRPCEPCSSWPAASPRRPARRSRGRSGRSCWAAPPGSSSDPRRSTRRSPSRAPGRSAPPSVRAS